VRLNNIANLIKGYKK